jgi:hypothetical protein
MNRTLPRKDMWAILCFGFPVFMADQAQRTAKRDARTHAGAGVQEQVVGSRWGEHQEESVNALVERRQKSWTAVSLSTRINEV